MKKTTFVTALFFLALAGCAKLPERIESPGLKIDYVVEDKNESFALRFSGGIKNQNPDTAFVDYKGQALFLDPAKKGEAVKVLDFTLPAVLPFDASIIDIKMVMKQDEILPIMKLLNIDLEKLKKDKSIEKFDIDERYIGLRYLSSKSMCITDLLKEKVK